jgi:hypothetical protein
LPGHTALRLRRRREDLKEGNTGDDGGIDGSGAARAGGPEVTLAALVVGLAAALLALTPFVDRYRRRELRRLLRDVSLVLDAHGVDYWCDFGTLLGLVRDGDLILGDKDVDLSVPIGERPRVMALAAVFAELGYRVTDQGGAARKLLRVLDARTPFYADLYPYEREGETLRSVLNSPAEDLPAALISQRRRLAAFGASLPAPADLEAMLVLRYGPDYRVPRRNDKGSARPYSRWRSLWEDLEANVVFLWFFLRNGLWPFK